MIKIAYLVRRRRDLTHANFVSHWTDVHAPLARDLPRIRGYRINPRTGESESHDCLFDGFAELWFDSYEDTKAAWKSDAGRAASDDAKLFLERANHLIVDEIDAVPKCAQSHHAKIAIYVQAIGDDYRGTYGGKHGSWAPLLHLFRRNPMGACGWSLNVGSAVQRSALPMAGYASLYFEFDVTHDSDRRPELNEQLHPLAINSHIDYVEELEVVGRCGSHRRQESGGAFRSSSECHHYD